MIISIVGVHVGDGVRVCVGVALGANVWVGVAVGVSVGVFVGASIMGTAAILPNALTSASELTSHPREPSGRIT